MSANILAPIILTTAVLIRIYVYLRTPSFWVDEILLAMNVITHPLLALAHKLDFEQFAPLGFLWIERLIVDCAGASERSLRLLPLIAGCLSVIAVWDMSRRFLNRYSAWIAAALIGFSPFAIRYSNEAKQYGVDLFVAAMLLWLRSYWGDMPRKPIVQAVMIAIGSVACLLSMPAIFVLAGLWVSYAAVALRAENRRPALIFVGLSGFIWSATFAVIYATFLAPNSDAYLRKYWLPLDLSVHLRGVKLGSLITHGFLDPCLSINSRIPMPLFATGCISLILGGYVIRKLRGAQVALLFVTPLALCLAAALIGKWYLTPRLMMFTAPLSVVLIAASISWITNLMGRFSAQAQVIAAVAIIAFPLKGARYVVFHPTVEDLRGAVEFCQRAMQPGDVLYISARAMPGWMFYSIDWAKPDRARYNWLKSVSEERGSMSGNIPSRGHRVVSEGLDLWHPYRQGVELAGIGEGIFYGAYVDWMGKIQSTNPDPGWSDNEVQRILTTHRRRIILLTSRTPERSVSALLDCLGGNGGAVIDEFRGEGSRADIVEMRGSEPWTACSY